MGASALAAMLFVGIAVWQIADLAVNGSRDHYAACQQEGYEAGRQGVPAEACPYTPGDDGPIETQHRRWKQGWTQGYLEWREAEKRR